MRIHLHTILFAFLYSAGFGQISPVKTGELSSAQLLSVKRLVPTGPEQGPDGLFFCFLVSRTPAAQHRFALKETRDFKVMGQSYRSITETALGQVFEPGSVVHDSAKYVAEHPEAAAAVSAAPQRSLIVTVAISGSPLKDGQDIEIILHVGFGRTGGVAESEDLIFRTKVPGL